MKKTEYLSQRAEITQQMRAIEQEQSADRESFKVRSKARRAEELSDGRIHKARREERAQRRAALQRELDQLKAQWVADNNEEYSARVDILELLERQLDGLKEALQQSDEGRQLLDLVTLRRDSLSA